MKQQKAFGGGKSTAIVQQYLLFYLAFTTFSIYFTIQVLIQAHTSKTIV